MSLDYKTDAALQKRLHDELAILVSLPHNNTCCDCGAITPKWASVNLGVFICIRCAGIHRSIGTHITKVRSITLDSWTEEQVEVMRKVGNTNAKKIWENNSTVDKKPDMDQHRLERFIRDKYERKRFFNQQYFTDVFAGKYRQQVAGVGVEHSMSSQNSAIPQHSQNSQNENEMSGSKQLNFMPPSKFGTKRASQPVDQFNQFSQYNHTHSPSPQIHQTHAQTHSPTPQIQPSKSADVFDFGPDIEFQGSFDAPEKPTKSSKTPNPSSGNVFDFLDSSEVQTMPQNTSHNISHSPNISHNVSQNISHSPSQNVSQNQTVSQPKYQKKSDILFSQPTQTQTSQNSQSIFDQMGGMNQQGMRQQQSYDMTQRSFDYMSLYQQPQRQMQQNQMYGQQSYNQGMQQNGMYNQMYGQQGFNQNRQGMQGGMQMPQRDYSSIGKYYV